MSTEIPASPAIDALNIGKQLGDLKKLKDGWASGMQTAGQWGESYGRSLSPQGLDWLAQQFSAHYPDDLPRPYLYPTPEGGVQAEWSLDSSEVSLEVHLADHSAEWDCLNLRTGDASERTLHLDNQADWEWIEREMGNFDRQL